MSTDKMGVAQDIIRLAASGLFDFEWYVANAGDLPDDVDPLVHFCKSGWRRGDDPNPLFATNGYLERNPDVREAGMNPVLHYLNFGEAEGRRPFDGFDAGWYRQTYNIPERQNCLADHLRRRRAGLAGPSNGDAEPDDATSAATEAAEIERSGLLDPGFYREAAGLAPDADPVAHFCRFGWRAHRNPNPVFNTAWYLAANDDVRGAGINPLLHYLRYGEAEGRAPSPDFDPGLYRARHAMAPDESCLRHHLAHAQAAEDAQVPVAGRELALVEQSELFDINYYLASYPDVRQSGLDPLAHFMTYGWQEGRRPNPYFDPAWYRTTHLAGADRNPLLHYIGGGEREGLHPIVYFDPAWYRDWYGLEREDSPLLHFLRHRRSQYFSSIKLFDVAWYVGRHGAEIGPNRDPFAHYLRVGLSGDVDPSPDFDARRYRQTEMNGDLPPPRPRPGAEIQDKLRREALHPFVHYLLRQTGRETPEAALSRAG